VPSVRADPAALRTRIRGSLLGGALGDALGWPVEFASLEQIRRRYGPVGITAPPAEGGGVAEVTDDTQMTLFTAEGLILAARAGALGRPDALVRIVHRASLRWLRTQGATSRHPSFAGSGSEGWLLCVPELHARRAPGSTCFEGLQASRMGSPEHPLNTSKGCGGVMRIAPVGLALAVDDPFTVGGRIAALTHGHPSGWLAAGAMAGMVRDLLLGGTLEEALAEALETLERAPGGEETHAALRRARDRVSEVWRSGRRPGPEDVEALGQGWVAEEALAIGWFCAAVHPSDLPAALCLAANHSGDSDSTASIAGQLLGVALGEEALPPSWLDRLELRSTIAEIADRLAAETCGRFGRDAAELRGERAG